MKMIAARAGTRAPGESPNAATPAGTPNIPTPTMLFTRFDTDSDIVDEPPLWRRLGHLAPPPLDAITLGVFGAPANSALS
mmetsp:Transcript_1987/g.5261  ORF Transcript_1987/g.5261 Transcript_1987/m.5261 type:complete len:80 (+) Transcript_1987:1368-1607(+)